MKIQWHVTKLWKGRAFCALALVLAPHPAAHAAVPTPPCAGTPVPAYAAIGAPPHIMIFHGAELGRDWPLDACANLPARSPALLIGLAGRFAGPPDRDALLARIGAISTLAGMRYWSVLDARWDALVTGAAALAGPRPELRRPDFTAAELASGQDFYFVQDDNRSSAPVIYRMQIRGLTPHGFVVETENLSPVRYLIMTIYRPGDLRSEIFLGEDPQGGWDYYGLTAIAAEPRLFGTPQRSSINRAAALFRHIAGIPTDQEPPAAP